MLAEMTSKDIKLNYDFNRFNSTIKFLHMKNVLDNLLKDSTKDVFVSKELLETLSVTIDELKDNMNINVIYQCKHFNYKYENWESKKGYWIRKNKTNKNTIMEENNHGK